MRPEVLRHARHPGSEEAGVTHALGRLIFRGRHGVFRRARGGTGGDSISAGISDHERCWPATLSDLAGVPVVSLAKAGATAESALVQAKGITRPNSLVIVEIGGNDLLGDTDDAAFHRQLDTLLNTLHAQGHRLLMVELPLVPFRNAYGKAQRELARKYTAALLPKRCLSKVLGMQNGTVDGLHLSPDGHAALARIIAGTLEIQK